MQNALTSAPLLAYQALLKDLLKAMENGNDESLMTVAGGNYNAAERGQFRHLFITGQVRQLLLSMGFRIRNKHNQVRYLSPDGAYEIVLCRGRMEGNFLRVNPKGKTTVAFIESNAGLGQLTFAPCQTYMTCWNVENDGTIMAQLVFPIGIDETQSLITPKEIIIESSMSAIPTLVIRSDEDVKSDEDPVVEDL